MDLYKNSKYETEDFLVYACKNITAVQELNDFPENSDGAIVSIRFASPPTGNFSANRRKSSTLSNFLKIYKNLEKEQVMEFLSDKSFDMTFVIFMKADKIEDLGFANAKIDLEEIYLDLPEKMDEPAIKPMMLEMFGFFVNEKEQEEFYFDQICNTIINHIIHAYWLYEMTDTEGTLPIIKSEKMTRTLDYIAKFLNESLPLKDLAKRVNMSPYYFARAFKNTVGMPPHQYILMRRVLKAQKLLKNTTIALADVAKQCGFHDQSHFNHKFKGWTGSTPRQYRKSSQEGKDNS